MVARTPLDLHFEAGAVHEHVQPPLRPVIHEKHVNGFWQLDGACPDSSSRLTTIRSLGVTANGGISLREGGVKRRSAIGPLTAATPRPNGFPLDRNYRSSALPQRLIVALPVGGLVVRVRRSARAIQSARSIHVMNTFGFAKSALHPVWAPLASGHETPRKN